MHFASKPISAFLSLLMLLLGAELRAQGPAPVGSGGAERPRIGLVLSGGGARGLAHVGVLEVLEELEIPIDVVAGTSMGAVIGGLYAAGLAPATIKRELLAVDWAQLLSGQPPRRDLSFRRKEIDRRYLFEVGVGKGGLSLPRSVVSMSGIDLLLRSQTLHVAGIEDFDLLPLPFRAVAVDLVTSEVVVLDSGGLVQAMRASMAMPGLFPPVPRGDGLLIDGGVLDNLPVDVALSMGADIVIAVDVGSPLLGSEELRGVSQILGQLMSVATASRVNEQKARVDLLITPELASHGIFDFAAPAEIIAAGELAARQLGDELRAYAFPAAFAEHVAARQRLAFGPPTIVGISIEGEGRVSEALIRARMKSQVGEPLDIAVLQEDLHRIQQLPEFESVGFDLEAAELGSRLIIRLVEKPWGPNFLRFGILLEDDLRGDNGVDILVNHSRPSLNERGAEWRNELQVGQVRRAFSELYQPVDWQGHWFVAPSVEARKELTDIYAEGRKIAEYDVRLRRVRLDLGAALGPFGEVRFGLLVGDAKAEAAVGVQGLPDLDVAIAGVAGRFVIDRLDGSGFPRRGGLAVVEGFLTQPAWGAEDDYFKLTGAYSRFLSRGNQTFFLSLAGGGAVDGDLPPYDELLLGGLFSLSGYGEGELRGQYSGVARSGYLHRLASLPLGAASPVYVGGWLEAGNVWATTADIGVEDLRYSLTLTLGADTPLGPVYLAYGLAEENRNRFYVVVGRRF
jgi:NTE family protein